ncbi:MAG: hypothetical protein AAF623_18400 [Planctomycetota bacterium]
MIDTFFTASQILAGDVFLPRKSNPANEIHLMAAVDWLRNAHDQSPDDGVSYGYCLRGPNFKRITDVGWKPSYVETSGYILETFYDLANEFDNDDFRSRAESIARWLVSVQNQDGSFANDHFQKGKGIVFDTGQVLFGLVRAYRETNDPTFLACAEKAAYWLVESLDADGAWRRNTHLNHVHTYNTRVAWAMLELDRVHPGQRIREAAARNLQWALTQQTEGFFRNCAFQPDVPPFTHTIAYAIRGIYEGGMLLNDQAIVDAAYDSAARMLSYVDSNGFIPGRIDIDGNPKSRSCCLTGNCQMAIIWLKIAEEFAQPAMKDAGNRALRYVMSVQNVKTRDVNIRGAIKGSHPVWGTYAPLSYPNWATKFFIEAMLLQRKS